MKYGVFTYRESCNLGDYIQAIAAMQFLPRIDHYIDIDHTNETATGDDIKMIFNGWFMHLPENWPPPKNIHPLFISFHLTRYADTYRILTRAKLKKFYKRYAPIGCRDYHTLELFNDMGVEAYFSGCLTTTLRNKFKKRSDYVVFVDTPFNDAYYNCIGLKNDGYLESPVEIDNRKTILKDKAASDIYLSKIPPAILENAKFVTHVDRRIHHPPSKFEDAKRLLDIYALAKMVVTSRLHCALPCIGLGTPVLFIKPETDPKEKDYSYEWRYGGLLELIRHCSMGDILNGHAVIGWDDPGHNPVDISEMAGRLRKTCEKFIAAEHAPSFF